MRLPRIPLKRPTKRIVFTAVGVALLVVIALGIATRLAMQPMPQDLNQLVGAVSKSIYQDRHNVRLNTTYANHWNLHDQVALHHIPEFLQRAFIVSEDKRFYQHNGVDWLARLHAVKQNLMAGGAVRGASTISEQVVRMLHPRPRTIWSRWVEGFEAYALEQRFSKVEIFEFYLNQVPYMAQRRGVVQAARYYFGRDLSTLNRKEMLTLAILVRAPHWLDPNRRQANLQRALDNLIPRMQLTPETQQLMAQESLALQPSHTELDASHFIQYAGQHLSDQASQYPVIHTTLDAELQAKVQNILDNRLQRLASRQVNNGAVLIVDHRTNDILAWVIGYAGQKDKAFNGIDAITTPRQPGSTLKPLLYAKAIQTGWTAATMIDDSPLAEGVGQGMHTYHNYSHGYYGPISLREALGNSLNIPAVRAMQYVGPEEFLRFMYELGVTSLDAHPNVYGDGLALGNGELTLYELVQAYTVLARMGSLKPLSFIEGAHLRSPSHRVLSEDNASLIADILSDPAAREKEFGWDSILNLPYQTAVKTGTSSDYRDAWTVGFNDRYTVGVWMGNLDYHPMQEITGSRGPALVLRSVFSELNKNRDVRPLYHSPQLVRRAVCIDNGQLVKGQLADGHCQSRDEWFLPGTAPNATLITDAAETDGVRIRKPSPGLKMAMDPRIPDEAEYFEFALTEVDNLKSVTWFINGQAIAKTSTPRFAWKLSKGTFTTHAEVTFDNGTPATKTQTVRYYVN